jgi:glutaredoxin
MDLSFVYIPVDQDQKYIKEFKERFPEAKTVPQILWDNRHVGGYTELVTEIENLNLGNYGQGAF